MGFRSYIREFLVVILMLFRPSGPCCLGVAEALFLSLESSVAKIILLVFSHSGAVAILMLFRPSLPWCFPIRGLSFEQKE